MPTARLIFTRNLSDWVWYAVKYLFQRVHFFLVCAGMFFQSVLTGCFMVRYRLVLRLMCLGCMMALCGGAAAQPFSFTLVEQALEPVQAGAVTWGDYDQDGDYDLLITGAATLGLEARLYRNTGTGQFADTEADLTPVSFAAAAWGDYDNDGDLDLLLAGSTTREAPYAPLTQLYQNDNGTFVPVDAPFVDLHSGSAAWGDYDNDGDQDLLLTGSPSSDLPYAARTVLYANAGSGSGTDFIEIDTSFPGITFGEAQWGDYDSDGDLDILLTGFGSEGFTTAVYRNAGSGAGTGDGRPFADAELNLPALGFSAGDWGDYDRDGDLDLLLSGGGSSTFVLDGASFVYRNDGSSFSRVDFGLKGLLAGTARWGDYNGDDNLDVLLLGADQPFGRYSARVYQNQGGTAFEEHALLVGVILGNGSWGDYDGDGDLDLIVIGRTAGLVPEDAPDEQNSVPAAHLYRNDRSPTDFVPAAPAQPQATVTSRTATLTWASATAATLTFNVQVGTTPGGTDVLAAQADPTTGQRYVLAPGNAQGNTTWTLHNLEPGTYYWQVQAVNGAYVGSPFVTGGAFEIETTAVTVEDERPAQVLLSANYPNPFTSGTTLTYTLDQSQPVQLRIYTVLGELVHLLVDEVQAAGAHTVYWSGAGAEGTPVSSGLYLYELKAGPTVLTKKMMRVD